MTGTPQWNTDAAQEVLDAIAGAGGYSEAQCAVIDFVGSTVYHHMSQGLLDEREQLREAWDGHGVAVDTYFERVATAMTLDGPATASRVRAAKLLGVIAMDLDQAGWDQRWAQSPLGAPLTATIHAHVRGLLDAEARVAGALERARRHEAELARVARSADDLDEWELGRIAAAFAGDWEMVAGPRTHQIDELLARGVPDLDDAQMLMWIDWFVKQHADVALYAARSELKARCGDAIGVREAHALYQHAHAALVAELLEDTDGVLLEKARVDAIGLLSEAFVESVLADVSPEFAASPVGWPVTEAMITQYQALGELVAHLRDLG